MKLRFAFLGLLSLIAVSCSYEESFVPEDDYDNSTVEFYALIDEQPDADTKVYADDQLRVLWNADDRITIFNKNTYNQQYRFTGVDGDNAGGFRIVKSDDEFITSNPLDNTYAVYPYRETNKISNDGVVTTSIPSEQTYKANSFGIGSNTMVSVAESNMLKFKNVGGYLSLKFYGEGVSVSSITLKSNNGELIAGDCTVNMSSGTPVSSLVSANATDEIILTCESPVELGATASEATQFIFVLSPVTLSGGFTVTVTTPEGGVFEKSSTNRFVISRSSITRIGATEVVMEYPQPNNVIYYTSTNKKIVTPYSVDEFGVNIVSNEYVDGRGVMTFDGDITRIGRQAFLYRYNLSSIAIPNSVTSIDFSAFYGCYALASIAIPGSVVSIAENAFGSCRSLESICVDSGNCNYDSRNDCNAIIETGTNTLIAGCKNTIIPDSVTCIGHSSFEGCSGLTSIDIPSSVTRIGNNAFAGCAGLSSFTIPNSVKTIDSGAFQNCTGLTSIEIPGSVTSIGYIVFSNCSGLEDIHVSPENKVFDSRNNCNAIIETATNTLRVGCKSTIIPESVIKIGTWAFYDCGILSSIVIPESVEVIGSGSFLYCSGLNSIVLPSSVKRIENQAFEHCINLVFIRIAAETPPSMSYSDSFEDTNNCPIYVPAVSVDAYKSAEGWSNYADRIKAFPPAGEIDGHAYVDLGLPSGIMWATCNIGANSPEEFGNYFGWGEVVPNNHYCWDYYRFGSSESFSKYNSVDGLTQLDLEDDAAYVNWGTNWRMPTHEEESELVNNCSIEAFTLNGVSGHKFIGPNGNYIFFPLGGLVDGTDYAEKDDEVVRIGEGGWYWSSTLDGLGSDYAEGICFWPSLMLSVIDHERCDGHMIRPVRRN